MDSRADKLKSIFEKGAIYPVITPSFCIYDPIELIRKISDDVDIVQLRIKEGSDSDKISLARKFRENFKGLLIINDRADIALLSEADGVHIGQEDLSIDDVRKIDSNLLVGVSTHNKNEIDTAIKTGADYINIGPIFSTQTKAVSQQSLGIEYLKFVSQKINIPFSVMGGIKLDNIEQIVAAGARICAAVTAITQNVDPGKTVKIFNEKIRSAIKKNYINSV
ncbi:MAG: thiamine phosphate synthase [Epsilonproteobacteria bacterium]|nr:thiamine phosphate synthase [Campylobacterota bacterium]